MKGILILVLVVLLVISIYPQVSESKLKLIFIERFTRFIEWSPQVLSDENRSSFRIGIVGEVEFKEEMAEFFAEIKVKERDVELMEPDQDEEYQKCHLLFISTCEPQRLAKIIESLKGKPVLTITDVDSYLEKGLLISLNKKGKNLRFRVNEAALEESGLQSSYLLLEWAELVNPLPRSQQREP